MIFDMDIKIISGLAAAVICSCTGSIQECQMGTYGYDLAFLEKQNIDVVELKSDDGQSKVMVIPAWQGRVMTSTTGGNGGDSYAIFTPENGQPVEIARACGGKSGYPDGDNYQVAITGGAVTYNSKYFEKVFLAQTGESSIVKWSVHR